jgi:hypothetical protein
MTMTQRHGIPTVLHHFVRASLIVGMVGQSVLAKPAPEPSIAAFNPDLVQQGKCTPTTGGITDSTIQQEGLTEPSLWWVRDQIAAQDKYGRRLVDSWLACQETGEPNRVDLVVNAQLWSLLDFFDRYEFIEKFGTATTGYGYNLRIFSPQGRMLAAYTCDFDSNVATKQAEPKVNPTGSEATACTSFDRLAKTNFWSPAKSAGGF